MLPLVNARTHEVHSLVAFLAFRGSIDMEDILSACPWAPHSTFTHNITNGTDKCPSISNCLKFRLYTLYPRCIMTRPFIEYLMFDHGHVLRSQ